MAPGALPVVGAVGWLDRGVGRVGDQPVEAIVGPESDWIPVIRPHVIAVGIEVSGQDCLLFIECLGIKVDNVSERKELWLQFVSTSL